MTRRGSLAGGAKSLPIPQPLLTCFLVRGRNIQAREVAIKLATASVQDKGAGQAGEKSESGKFFVALQCSFSRSFLIVSAVSESCCLRFDGRLRFALHCAGLTREDGCSRKLAIVPVLETIMLILTF